MSRPRKKISINVLYAAALLQIRDEETGEPLIPHDHAKLMTADNIISLFHADHYPIPHAEDGPDEPWNITHRFIPAHRKKTAEIDVPQIAKNKRIAAGHAAHQAAMDAKLGLESENPDLASIAQPGRTVPKPRPKSRWPQGRKLQTRPFRPKGKKTWRVR